MYLGAGVKVLGDVKIGRHTSVGANAVVTTDLPPESVAAGIPARVLRKEALGRHVAERKEYSEGVGDGPATLHAPGTP